MSASSEGPDAEPAAGPGDAKGGVMAGEDTPPVLAHPLSSIVMTTVADNNRYTEVKTAFNNRSISCSPTQSNQPDRPRPAIPAHDKNSADHQHPLATSG